MGLISQSARSVNQNQSSKHPIQQSTNQPTNQSTGQTIKQLAKINHKPILSWLLGGAERHSDATTTPPTHQSTTQWCAVSRHW
jgi:hypothetical protein